MTQSSLLSIGHSMQTSQTMVGMMAKSELKLMKQTYKTKLEQMETASHGEPQWAVARMVTMSRVPADPPSNSAG
jgi:hypothetical protein